MGLLVFLFIFVAAVALIKFRQRLEEGRQNCEEAFAAVRAALARRHRAARRLLEVSQIYLIREEAFNDEITRACTRAETLLDGTAKCCSAAAAAELDDAETALTRLLQRLQNMLEAHAESKGDKSLIEKSELLDSSETDTAAVRRSYNRSAELYNSLLGNPPLGWCAGLLGHPCAAGLLAFEDNNAQMSRNLIM